MNVKILQLNFTIGMPLLYPNGVERARRSTTC
jgi:hypothetical protein